MDSIGEDIVMATKIEKSAFMNLFIVNSLFPSSADLLVQDKYKPAIFKRV